MTLVFKIGFSLTTQLKLLLINLMLPMLVLSSSAPATPNLSFQSMEVTGLLHNTLLLHVRPSKLLAHPTALPHSDLKHTSKAETHVSLS